MTDDQYRERILEVERYSERLSFLCPRDCPAGDFWEHAETVARHLSDVIDADYYGVDAPSIATAAPHLDADIARHLRRFEERWNAT